MTTLDRPTEPIITSAGGIAYNKPWLDYWRERALAAEASSRALPTQPVEVTEEMVNAACRAMEPDFPVGWNPNHALKFMRGIHRALEAALATRPSGDGIRAGRAEVIEECAKIAAEFPYMGEATGREIAARLRALIVPQEAVKE